MKKLFWVVAGFGLLSVLVAGRMESGGFAALQEVWAGPQGAIVATGLPPQIELIEKVADDSGWRVDCKRPDGELTLVQFTPTFWAKFEDEELLRSELSLLATSTALLKAPSGDGQACGAGAAITSSEVLDPEGTKELLLAYGTGADIGPLISLAKKCSLEGLAVRPLTQAEQEWIGGEIPADWQGLGIELSSANKNQYICFGALAQHQENGG